VTAAQQQAATIRAEARQAGSEEISCIQSVYDKPEYTSIVQHLPAPGQESEPTMAQLADNSLPTKKQRKLLISLHDEIVPCNKEALNRLVSIMPGFATIAADTMIAVNKLTLKLVERKITWGKYNQKGVELRVEMRERARPIIQQMNDQLVAEHEDELAQRQQFAQALVQWAQCHEAGVSSKNCLAQLAQ
jgi:hypothetical protein